MTATADHRIGVRIACRACRGRFPYGPVPPGTYAPCCPYCGVRNKVNITREASA